MTKKGQVTFFALGVFVGFIFVLLLVVLPDQKGTPLTKIPSEQEVNTRYAHDCINHCHELNATDCEYDFDKNTCTFKLDRWT